MPSYVRECVRVLTTCILIASFTVPSDALAQIHVVSPTDLQKEAVAATQTRKRNLETVRQFLSSQAAEKALNAAYVHPEQVKTAVSTLSDQELSQLASRAHKAQADFAAGTLSNRDLIIIIIAIAAIVLIVVAVREDHH